MKKYLFIALGGSLGAVLRYLSFKTFSWNSLLPVTTLIINELGAFLLAFLVSLSFESLFGEDLFVGLTSGFLGALTTFSTLEKEIFTFYSKGSFGTALLYALISVGLGLAAVGLGFKTGEFFNEKILSTLDAVTEAEEE